MEILSVPRPHGEHSRDPAVNTEHELPPCEGDIDHDASREICYTSMGGKHPRLHRLAWIAFASNKRENIMSFGKTAIAMAATAVLGTFGVSPAYAATPHCGVFTADSGFVTVVSEDGQYSNSKLYNEGRFSARGPQFGCWIEIGRSPDLFTTMMYSYRVTDPKGQSMEFGPYGIQVGGFGSTSVPTYQTAGVWRMEFFLVSRANLSKSSIGAINFTMLP